MGQEKTNSTVRIDMLHGGIFRKLLLFALPLIASGILQQSFNSVGCCCRTICQQSGFGGRR